MFNKKIIMMLIIFIVSLFAISAVSAADNATEDVVSVEKTIDEIESVCASDVNEAIVTSEDTNQMELSSNDEITENNLQTNEENNILTRTDNNESVGAGNNLEILGDDMGNYSGLANEIQSGGNIELKHKYYKYDSGSTIEITGRNRVIDGKGAVIDMVESPSMRALLVNASGVTIKNLTIKNANYNNNGGAIYFITSGTVTNCTFTNNKATGDYIYGGAVYFEKSSTVRDCIFTDNTASEYGGAVCMSGSNCSIINSTFTENNALSGSAIYSMGDCVILNSTFINNRAVYSGGAVCAYGKNTEVINSTFMNNRAVNYDSVGGAIYASENNGKIINSIFSNNKAGHGGAIYATKTTNCIVINSTFTNNAVHDNNPNEGDAIKSYFGNIVIYNSSFESNTWYIGNQLKFFNITIDGNEFLGLFECMEDNSQINLINDYNFMVRETVYANNVTIDGKGNRVYSIDDGKDCKKLRIDGKNIILKNIIFDRVTIDSYSHNLTIVNCSFLNINTNENVIRLAHDDIGRCMIVNSSIIGSTAPRAYGLIYVGSSAICIITNSTFINNYASYGGAISSRGDCIVSNSLFINNSASEGGAIYGECTVINCTFTNNYASYGGAISSRGGCVVSNSLFINNSASYGGAIHGFYVVSNSLFINNSAVEGGAISLEGKCSIINSTFLNNSANYGNGGAIYSWQGCVILNSTFTNNRAVHKGGAIYALETTNINNTSFMGNGWYSASQITFSNITVDGCEFIGISKDIEDNSQINLTNDLVVTHTLYIGTNNVIIDGNGNTIGRKYENMISITGKNVTLKNIKFNQIRIESFSSNLTIINCSFINSTLYGEYTGKGGAILVMGENCTIINSTFTNCTGIVYDFMEGCAIYVGAEKCSIINSTFISNNAGKGSLLSVIGENCNIINSIFMNHEGRVLDVCRENCTIINSTFINNGGRVIDFDGNSGHTILNSIFRNNRECAILLTDCTASIINVTFANNAYGIRLGDHTTITISNSTFANQSCGMMIISESWVKDTNCDIINSTFINIDEFVKLTSIYTNEISCNIINSTFIDSKLGRAASVFDCKFMESTKTIITANVANLHLGENISIITSVLDNNNQCISGVVDLYINSKFMGSQIIGEVFVYHPTEFGNYLVESRFNEISDYCGSSGNFSFTVCPNLSMVVKDIVYGESTNITVNLDIDTNVTLELNGQKYIQQVCDGKTVFNISGLKVGTYNVKATVLGNEKYNSCSVLDSFKVSKISISSLIYSRTIKNDNYNIKLPSDATGTVMITINNIKYSASLVDGKTSINLSKLSNGDYTYKLVYSGDNKYYGFTYSSKILTINRTNVGTITPDISIPPLENVSAGGNVPVTLPSDAGGTVTLTINGTDYTFKVSNGKTDVKLPDLSNGDYPYTITYSGDSKYSSFNSSGSLKVKNTAPVPLDNTTNATSGNTTNTNATNTTGGNESETNTTKPTPEIVVPPLDKSSADGSVPINLPSDATGTVTLVIGGKDYSYSVVNGVANVYMPDLNNGNYDYTITYSGDGKYSTFTNTGSVKINKIIPTVLTASPVTTVYNGGKDLVITLKDVNGNPISRATVTVVLGGKTYTPNTDKNGQVKISTNGLKPVNKYWATITFNGNANYDKSSTTAKVKVNKAYPKFKYSAATFKRTDKKKKYTIRFLTNQNTAMKYAKVYIKINKKVYAAKTNKKGFATFKLTKLTKKGKHTANIIFKGDGYYNKLTKNVKIRVK